MARACVLLTASVVLAAALGVDAAIVIEAPQGISSPSEEQGLGIDGGDIVIAAQTTGTARDIGLSLGSSLAVQNGQPYAHKILSRDGK